MNQQTMDDFSFKPQKKLKQASVAPEFRNYTKMQFAALIPME